MTRKNQPTKLVKSKEAEIAFESQKRSFTSSPICILPNMDEPFASDQGLGAMLMQDRGEGLQPVACASKKLSHAEVRYPTVEKECLAITWGIHRFKAYLYGRKFVVQTDHSPLQYLDSMKSKSGRLTR